MTPIESDQGLARERRRHEREPCWFRGRLMHGEGEAPCTVVDLSPGGARIRTDQALETHAAVRLKMTRDGEFSGEVVWAAPGALGLQFNHRPLA